MKTSSFFLYQGPGRISIARFAPKGTPPGFKTFRELAPSQDMLKMSYTPYREKYFDEILGKLDPAETWERLHDLTAPNEPVLLCWENLSHSGKWCHRRMVAEWFEKGLGVTIPEL